MWEAFLKQLRRLLHVVRLNWLSNINKRDICDRNVLEKALLAASINFSYSVGKHYFPKHL